MSDDVELLINAIQERPILWDKRNKNYHNRLLSHREWETLAKKIGTTIEPVKKKWKNIRDTFIRELKKNAKPRSGSDADNEPKYTGTWPYFETMSFLTVVLKPRKTYVNIQSTFQAHLPSPATKKKGTKRKRDDDLQAYMELEKVKLKLLREDQKDATDDDLLWFKSILPYMKQLPSMNKLRFRTQMQEHLLDELSKL